MKQVTILDTTMRDGEQSPGIAFGRTDKQRIARMLVACGVSEAEVGTPAMGKEEMAIITALVEKNLPLRLFTWNRALKKDIDMSIACGVTNLFISSPVSDLQIKNKLGKDREWVVASLQESIMYARSKGCYVACGLEDSSRADLHFLTHLIRKLEEAGVQRVRISDTVGILTPASVYDLITRIKQHATVPLGIHTHNDFGMATANALAAFVAGATFIDTTLLGIGERAGNAALDEIATALKILYHIDSGVDLPRMKKMTKIFARMIRQPISKWRPVTGANAFRHESGIHVDGVIKNPTNYEPYPPELTGTIREFVIGKHSGRKAVEHKYEELGIRLSERELEDIAATIRSRSLVLKRSLEDKDLIKIWQEMNKIKSR